MITRGIQSRVLAKQDHVSRIRSPTSESQPRTSMDIPCVASIWCQHGELTRSSSSRCTRDRRIELMTLAAAGNYLQARPLRIQSVCWQLYINPSYSRCLQFIQNAILPFVFRNFFCSSFDFCALINPFNSLLDCSCEFQPFGKLVFRVPNFRRWVDLCSSDGNELSSPGRYAVSAHHYEFPRWLGTISS
jgi:hypothetical protein